VIPPQEINGFNEVTKITITSTRFKVKKNKKEQEKLQRNEDFIQ
jgi:hypothetical protein